MNTVASPLRRGYGAVIVAALLTLSAGPASSQTAIDGAGGGEARQQSSASSRSSAWQSTDCIRLKVGIEDDQIDCGYVSVPRRHADPAGPAIRLATVIIKSQAAGSGRAPLFIAQGGPGGSSIDSFAQLLISDPATRPAADRDLIVWDQRGTLFSEPALTCPEVSKA